MADKYADLRAALDAGPKPGKWTWKQVGSFNAPGCAVFWPDTSKGGVHYRRLDSGGGMEQADAELIAACHPETIRALLAERDALEVATKEAAEVIVDRNDEIRRLREALRWAAGTLQAACGLAGPISESSPFKLGDETRTVAQICDAADAALAQGQS